MILKIFTDGGAKGNPGPAAIGIVFYKNEQPVFTYREDIGVATNNVAEYTAVIIALTKLKSQQSELSDVDTIKFYSDSNLLVNQVNGLYKIKNAAIREFVVKIRMLEQEIGKSISYTHIPREKNLIADKLVNNRL